MENNLKHKFISAIKAFVVGSTMTVPGVSGGSMAMILGEYDNLISSVNGLLDKKRFKASFIYLCVFALSALLGIFLISRPLSLLIDRHRLIIMYFFLGAIIGTIPMIVKASTLKRNDMSVKRVFISIASIAIGIALVLSVKYLPSNIFSVSDSFDIRLCLAEILGGIFLSIGFVLPGVSFSYLLVVVGLYENILKAVNELDIIPYIPLGIGLVIGVMLLTGILSWAMKNRPKVTYLMIFGFLLGSIGTVYPGLPNGIMILYSAISFVIGAAIIYIISIYSKE